MTFRVKEFFINLVIVGSFNIAYFFIISDIFSYMGFSAEFDIKKFIVTNVLTIILLFVGSIVQNNFLSLVWWVFFYIFFVGEAIYFQYSVNSTMYIVIGVSIFLVLLPFFSNSNKRLEVINIKGDSLSVLVIIAVVLFIPIFATSYKYINLNNLLLIDVYETRSVFREFNNPLIGYIRAPLVRIIAPYIIIKSMEKKKYIYASIGTGIIIFVYLSGALKSVFIGLFAVVLFYKGNYKYKKKILFTLMGIISIGGIVIYYFWGNIFLLDSFLRRVVFTPPYLNNIYVNYFNHNYTYLSHSPLGLGLVQYPYEKILSFFVGENVMGLQGFNANVGLFTEGFVSFGFFGILMVVFLLLLIFKYLDSLRLDPVFFGMVFVYIYYMNTAFLSTLLLTHGLLLFLVFGYFYLSKK
ncbi:hypothetical protein [Enterococcus lactis]|nr:oligosaccharide repeat unit polymerase [Enterococcus faecium]EGP5721170.1 hypothetical protein [Enterococcus faecium]NTQ72929.1 oligosaccharide repeat unit polymerase [Enterococcus faecium]NTQ88225.1 oligosaccharide repeat unit polymerase [Enterococcus faecium]